MQEFDVYPLFSSPIAISFVEDSYVRDYFYKNLDYSPSSADGSTSFYSTNMRILESLDKTKDVVMNKFNSYKNDVLKYHSTEFELTTSWFTKSRPNDISQQHRHANCMFSGVLYIDEYNEKTAGIKFFTPHIQSFMVNTPTEFNIFNCDTWDLQPRKNMIIFFPSYLTHIVAKNLSNENRYSLAFNFHPVGLYGATDSTIKINVVD